MLVGEGHIVMYTKLVYWMSFTDPYPEPDPSPKSYMSPHAQRVPRTIYMQLPCVPLSPAIQYTVHRRRETSQSQGS